VKIFFSKIKNPGTTRIRDKYTNYMITQNDVNILKKIPQNKPDKK